VLLFASLPLILRRLATHRQVTGDTIVGALCAYLLIGMDFAVLHVLFSVAEGQSIIASIVAPEAPITRGDFYYHSFMTMTTVGFGDFVPVNGAAKTLAVLEGILGQLFLITVVARLVSVATFKRYQPAHCDDTPADTNA
jgi:voltage-gated potassium channel Kch